MNPIPPSSHNDNHDGTTSNNCQHSSNIKKLRFVKKGYKQVGRVYSTCNTFDGKLNIKNLNGLAKLGNSNIKAVCRHMSLQQIIDWQAGDLSSEPKKPNYATLKPNYATLRSINRGTKEKMEKVMQPELDNLYQKIETCATENCLVEHSQWGMFLKHSFCKMKLANEKHSYWIVTSGSHAMAIRLRLKSDSASGKTKNVVTFNDPNYTLTDRRVFVYESNDFTNFLCSNFIDNKKDMELYFGKSENKNCENVVMFQRVPDNFYKTYNSGKANDFDKVYPQRRIKKFFPENETMDMEPVINFHLMNCRLPLTSLENGINNCKDNNKIIKMLKAENSDGMPGLFLALQEGHTDTVKEYSAAVLKVLETEKITARDAIDLLKAESLDGTPGLYMALQEGHTDTVEEYSAAVLKVLETEKITARDAIDLLKAE
ncbi:MAG: ShET2/EspL2 family type III secretion system effector toxin, partial [Desulfobacteraceae bacterium]|nr:ShET2/EspL2 family type III secretion system effector toxin [Desulfobacteraceae bacterium]